MKTLIIVRDSETNAPIPYAVISYLDTHAATNAMGEAVIDIPAQPLSLIIKYGLFTSVVAVTPKNRMPITISIKGGT